MTTKIKISLVLCVISIVSIITISIANTGITLHNPISDMTATIMNEVQAYGTDYVYIENMPSTAAPVVLEEGINGLDYTYNGLDYIHISDTKNEVVQVGSGAPGIFTGRLTGYGPDCPGCSKVGNVSCKTREGKTHSLTYDGLYYTDSVYGSARILAADHKVFPCGTIVKVDNGILDEFVGIVLDTGYTMREAWKQGTIWMDLAFTSEKESITGGATSSNTRYEVQRWGW